MKGIILPLLLMSSPVLAENSILSCFFKNNKNEHQRMIALKDMLAKVIMFAENSANADMTEARKVLNGGGGVTSN